ncbi:MAG: alanine dehydrogenase [Cytophagaceae bacterium]|nr:alanine dehydrogenase [Cytophagaceae bacterium]
MKFAIIKERKNPPDRRVVFPPQLLEDASAKFPQAQFIVEPSNVRIFSDDAYRAAGFEVTSHIADADVMIGVKEVPINALIDSKKYFFFSHTIKKQPYNRGLLQAILDKNIELYDHEVITNENGGRLIGFGRYAGLVGTYNGIRAWGLKYDTWSLPKADDLPDLKGMLGELNNVELPPIKICLTGSGKVAGGSREILEHMNIRRVGADAFINKDFSEPVYCNIDVLDYNKRIDGKPGDLKEFFTDPSSYKTDFYRFARVTDFFIAGHFYGDGAPYLFTREDAKKDDFNIKLVADISCDIDGPVASTIRPSTIEDPLYGYDPLNEREVAYDDPNAITVMAVDNLPCELPKDASEGFGKMFLAHVLPAFFNKDKNGILARARMTHNGKLTPRYAYLQDFIDGLK